MRRFISTFIGGRSALGLLLIRIAAGAALITDGKERLYYDQHFGLLALADFTIVGGVLLIGGLWTPLTGFLAVALSVGDRLIYHQGPCPAILLGCMGAGVAFIGPGALSMDAWLFGLERRDINKPEGQRRG